MLTQADLTKRLLAKNLDLSFNGYYIKKALSYKECDFLIDYHKKYFNLEKPNSRYYGGKLLSNKWNETDILILPHSSPFHIRKNLLRKKVYKIVSTALPGCTLFTDQIVRWGVNTKQQMHFDTFNCKSITEQQKYWTSIFYLNDNYEQGETIVEHEKIKPIKGDSILFKASVIKHGVNQVLGTRYTYIAWWREN